jgi:hypothetical protein
MINEAIEWRVRQQTLIWELEIVDLPTKDLAATKSKSLAKENCIFYRGFAYLRITSLGEV